ncbi:MAG: polysaccharide pyruvyl transferase family protein [Candidatus Peribacteraceae bacterium]|jgi:polysaccharide pyruvyl transferase WcaK-like protein
MRALLVGSYGKANLGDEALRAYFLTTFPDVQWCVTTAQPKSDRDVPHLPCGIRSFFCPWWKTLQALYQADVVVFGGGSLFTDTESFYACILWWWHALIFWLFRKRVVLAFQGIGPFKNRVGEWCTRWAVRRAALLTVRDTASYARVQSWGLNTKVVLSFDPIFSFIKKQNLDISTKNILIIIPRMNSSASFQDRARNLAQERPWQEVRILSLQPDAEAEQAVCRELASACGGATIVPVRTLDTLCQEVAVSALVLTQRYHGALAALALQKEWQTIPQAKGDKLAELLREDKHVLEERVIAGESALRSILMNDV